MLSSNYRQHLPYLDYNSTTPVDGRVFEAMRPWLIDEWGNASSREYHLGWSAAEAVEEARDAVAELIQAPTQSIVFTSGATESLSAALRSFVGYRDWHKKKLVTCATEHAAVLSTCDLLKKLTDVEVSVLPVDDNGVCQLNDVRAAVRTEKRCLVAVMFANNEIGTIQPAGEICQIAHEAKALFLCDLTQAIGKLPVDVAQSKYDFAACSAHKMYGPKGVGVLVIRDGVDFDPLIAGGGQERGRRGGTLNVPGIVGCGEACRIAGAELQTDAARMLGLRDKLESSLLAELPELWINAGGAQRLANTSHIGFRGVDAKTLIRDMHDLACSTKAACSSGDAQPSHVLKAIGLSDEQAYSCVRFSVGRFSTEAEIDYAIEKIVNSVRKLRRLGNHER